MFKGRKLVIATKHQKEKVIAPILEKELGVICFLVEDLNTDILGTFTGEVERTDDPIITARKKCLMAMELSQCDLAVASEGSFGQHPSLSFVPADDEFLLLIDKKNSLEIIARELSTATNFNGAQINTEEELNEFATHANFPSHGLILRKSKDDFKKIVKGISDESQLKNIFYSLMSSEGSVYIETDMRAMHNPTRMKVIEAATIKLAKKTNSLCPECQMPGFGITEAIHGLPCKECNFPTSSIISHIFSCQKCSFSYEKKHPNGKQTEDPMYCDNCNP
jgi:hypothetical protein